MKISVLGAGAIGSMFGGLIKYHDPSIEIVFIGRGDHGFALCEHQSIRLIGPWGMRHVQVRATSDMSNLSGSDFVFVTVKSQGTDEALAQAMPFLDGAIVVSIQNGINDATLEKYVPRQRLVMGMTAMNVAIVKPGSARLQLNGTTVVGPARDGTNAAVSRKVCRVLRLSGMRIVDHPNALGVRYNKLVLNAIGYSSCLSASNFITDAVCHKPWRDVIGRPLIDECLEVLRCARIRLARIPGGTDVYRILRAFRLLDQPWSGRAARFVAERIYNRTPIVFSLYQDLVRRKKTEVDFVNGQLVRLAHWSGCDAPYNKMVVQSVHELESRGDTSFFSREEVLERCEAVGTFSKFRVME